MCPRTPAGEGGLTGILDSLADYFTIAAGVGEQSKGPALGVGRNRFITGKGEGMVLFAW